MLLSAEVLGQQPFHSPFHRHHNDISPSYAKEGVPASPLNVLVPELLQKEAYIHHIAICIGCYAVIGRLHFSRQLLLQLAQPGRGWSLLQEGQCMLHFRSTLKLLCFSLSVF